MRKKKLPQYNFGGALTDIGMGLAESMGFGQLSAVLTGNTLADNLGYEYQTGAGQKLSGLYEQGIGAMNKAASVVPGIGQIQSMSQGITGQAMDTVGLGEMQMPAVQASPIVGTATPTAEATAAISPQRTPMQPISFMNGGYLPKYFMGGNMYEQGGLIEYKGPKHEQGGIPVASNGLPVDRNNAVGEVEGGETAHSGYIFSDTLKTKEGKTFAEASKELAAKFNIDNLEDYV